MSAPNLPLKSRWPFVAGVLVVGALVAGGLVLQRRFERKQEENGRALASALVRASSAKPPAPPSREDWDVPKPASVANLSFSAAAPDRDCQSLEAACKSTAFCLQPFVKAVEYARALCKQDHGHRTIELEECRGTNTFRESGRDSIVTRYYDNRSGELVGIVERMASGKRWCAGRPFSTDCKSKVCTNGRL